MDESDNTTSSTKLAVALRGLIALAIAMGIGRFAFTPQLPVMQADLDLSLAAGGWLAGANYFGYLIGAILAGRGGVPAGALMRWGLVVVVVSTAAMAAQGPLALWLAMRFIAGVASAWVLVGTASVVLSRLALYEGPEYDGVVFAGVGIGIALAGLVCHIGFLFGMGATSIWLALAGVALAGALIVLADNNAQNKPVVTASASVSSQKQSYQYDVKDVRRLVVCYGLFGVGYILPATYLPSQARLFLDDPALFGWVWPAFGLAAALSTLIFTAFAHWPRRYVWAVAQLIMTAGVLLPTMVFGITGLVFAAVCVGGTFMLITLLGLQEVRYQVGPNPQKWFAAMTAAFAVGQLCGPLIANVMLGIGWTLDAALWVSAFALLLSSFLLVSSPATKVARD